MTAVTVLLLARRRVFIFNLTAGRRAIPRMADRQIADIFRGSPESGSVKADGTHSGRDPLAADDLNLDRCPT